MSKKTITLLTEVFEVEKPIESVKNISINYHPIDIYEAYKEPSESKVDIWKFWCKWADVMNYRGYKVSIEISGVNCMFFSIVGTILFPDGQKANIWITYCHNRIYFEKEA